MAHIDKAREFLSNSEFARWQDRALWFVRQKRDLAIKGVDEWERLREVANSIKAHTLSNLHHYLVEFEKSAILNGFKVHWASDAKEANSTIYKILKKNRAKLVVKSKSMLTEECELNPFLENKGIEVIDTDLGERIIQLRGEKPSHIVLPAIHLKKEQVGETFEQRLGSQKGNCDPKYLTRVAREHLREKFLSADAAITGVNFAIAKEGSFVVCTNEGNADMGATLSSLHIAVMGIEKIIPKLEDLGVFTRLLARSATGQAITTYTSHFKRPKDGSEVHIVIVDNGRSDIIASKRFKNSLKCIRCGACMNTCPVYRRSGGHSYSYIIPGPIGSILGSTRSVEEHGDLVNACSLCGSCDNVCPVKIDLSHELLTQRESVAKGADIGKKIAFKVASIVMQHPKLLDLSFKVAKILPKGMLEITAWSRGRELPEFADKSFRELYLEERGRNG